MSIAEDQALVRSVNEQRIRDKARITYTPKTWAEKWEDVEWLQKRVTELERWHSAGGGHSWLDDDCEDNEVRICFGEHSAEDGHEWVTYRRVEE